jgi:chromosome segregation ATPase
MSPIRHANGPSSFVSEVNGRKADITREQHRLDAARARLTQDRKSLEESNTKAIRQKEELAKLSEDLRSATAQDMLGKEVLYRKMTLHKIEADLRQQLAFAEKELREAELQMDVDQADIDKATRRRLNKGLREKFLLVEILRNLMATFRNEILTKENEVAELEIRAQERRGDVEQYIEKRNALREEVELFQRRKKELLEKAKRIEKLTSHFGREQISTNRAFEEAIKEQLRLSQSESEIVENERPLIVRIRELEQERVTIETQRFARYDEAFRSHFSKRNGTESLINEEEEEEIEEKVGLVDLSDFNLIHLQYHVEQEERDLEKAIREHEIKKEKEETFWTVKLQRVEKILNVLNREITEHSPSFVDLEAKLAEIENENQRVQKELETKKESLREIKTQLQPDDDIIRRRLAADTDWKRVVNAECELVRQNADADRQERAMETAESRIVTEMAQLKEMDQNIHQTDAVRQSSIRNGRSTLAVVEAHVAHLTDAIARFSELFPHKPTE